MRNVAVRGCGVEGTEAQRTGLLHVAARGATLRMEDCDVKMPALPDEVPRGVCDRARGGGIGGIHPLED